MTSNPPTVDRPAKLTGFEMSRSQQALIDALESLMTLDIHQVDRCLLARMAEVSPDSGSMKDDLYTLQQAGMVCYPVPGRVSIRAPGRRLAAVPYVPFTLNDLHAAWWDRMTAVEQALLKKITGHFTRAIKKEALAEECGYSLKTGSFKDAMRVFSGLGLTEKAGTSAIRASTLLFPRRIKDPATPD